MRMRGANREQDYDCASIVAALAEVALGRPWVAFDQLIAEAYAVLPADVRARLVAYDVEAAATRTLRDDEFDGSAPAWRSCKIVGPQSCKPNAYRMSPEQGARGGRSRSPADGRYAPDWGRAQRPGGSLVACGDSD
jgi:hypothetical protein